jgi:hypothetical protein
MLALPHKVSPDFSLVTKSERSFGDSFAAPVDVGMMFCAAARAR